MSDFAALFKLLSAGGLGGGGGNNMIGTPDQPWNPAAKLATGNPMGSAVGQSPMTMTGPVLTPMPANPTQFGTVPGMPTTLTSMPGSNQSSPPSALSKLGMAVMPNTMSGAGKGGAGG